MGILAGGSFFAATGPLPEKHVPDLLRRLKSTIFNIDDVDRNHDLEVLFRGIEKILEDLVTTASMVEDLWQAADPKNLDLLGLWLQEQRHGRFKRDGQRLYRYDAAGNVVGVARGEGRVPAEFFANVPTSPVPARSMEVLRQMMRPR